MAERMVRINLVCRRAPSTDRRTLTALMLLLSTASALGGMPAPLGGGAESSTAACHRLLRLPKGAADYLPAYARLADYLFRHSGPLQRADGPAALKSALEKVESSPLARASLDAIEASTVHGTPPALLRREILRTLSLTGRAAIGSPHRESTYSLVHRMKLADLFWEKASQLSRLGHKRRAYRALRCWLYLYSQDDVAASRLLWCNLNSSVVPKFGMPHAVYHSLREYCRRAMRARIRFNQALVACPTVPPKPAGAGPQHTYSARQVVRGLQTIWALARPRLSWRYKVLQMAANQSTRAGAFGRRRALAEVKSMLGEWLRAARRSHSGPALERRAIIRWIKEAMGP